MPKIDWSSLSSSFCSIPSMRKIETVKWTSEFCATGKNLKRWREQSHSSCPVCGVCNETTHHILTCPHPSSTEQWSKSITNLEQWMVQQLTSPDIIRIVIENLRAWHDDRPSVLYSGPTSNLSDVIRHQSTIGWGSFLRGFLHKGWSTLQHAHYQTIKSLKSGKRWASELIKKLWLVSWDMWRFRNGILHSQSTTVPTNFTFLLSSTIIQEMNHGHRSLPAKCKYLFAQSIASILKGSVNGKKLWLATVWAARDLYSLNDVICQNRDSIVSAYVETWKKRIST